MIKAIGLCESANAVTVVKALRDVTGQSFLTCKHTHEALRDEPGASVVVQPHDAVAGLDKMPDDTAVRRLVQAGIIVEVDDVVMPPAAEIDLLRQEMRTQVERMASTLGGFVTWTRK